MRGRDRKVVLESDILLLDWFHALSVKLLLVLESDILLLGPRVS